MYYFFNVSGSGKLYFEFSTSNEDYAKQQIELRKIIGGYAIQLPNNQWMEG